MIDATDTRGWTLSEWQHAWRAGRIDTRVLHDLRRSLDARDPAWISIVSEAQLDAQLQQLAAARAAMNAGELPLYGIPFAVKDNLDAAGWSTTVACPAFAYSATRDATVVARLRAAGAVLMGKTNLDQFATGLVGTRSPYGIVPNSFDPEYISGGSSSGSASVVARGLVPFALGTDTAGSGRIPAAFNNIVGLKPTRGWLSTSGLVPACRTLDCVSVLALTVTDAALVAEMAGGHDGTDPWSRRVPALHAAPAATAELRLAVPDTLTFFGDELAARAFDAALATLRHLGAQLVPVDFAPFSELAALLYQGPWVAERTLAIGELMQRDPSAIDPVVRGIVEQGLRYSAVDAYRAEYRRAELTTRIDSTLADFDALVVPSSPTIRRIDELLQEPVLYNSQLGTYTNFTNLADLCALAVPATFREDGLPAGITFLARAWRDSHLVELGRRFHNQSAHTLGATGRASPPQAAAIHGAGAERVTLAVVGAHLSGMPLNWQLTTRAARLVETTTTAACYRLYALAGTRPAKPALLRAQAGAAIVVELWDLPLAQFGAFVAEIPPPLGIGSVQLADGRNVKGFICEAGGLDGAVDITAFGGWRAYLQQAS